MSHGSYSMAGFSSSSLALLAPLFTHHHHTPTDISHNNNDHKRIKQQQQQQQQVQASLTMETFSSDMPALVFGASGEQGRAVLEGFVDAGYAPVYGFTSDNETLQDPYLSDALQCVILEGSLGNTEDVRKALVSTKAQTIFLTTTTQMPVEVGEGYEAAQNEEYECIVGFFHTLKKVYEQDKLPRTIVFSTQDNVEELCRQHRDETGQVWIEPLDDGSVVPHFSAKGKGGQAALEIVKDTPDLRLILLTTPFFYSNFLAFFAPLPNEGRTQWELCASFGHGSTLIDMMSCADLGRIVVAVAENAATYQNQNLRIAAERISMDEIAMNFSDLYGKDVIYNPLLPNELAELEFASAPAMAQMCQYLGSKTGLHLQHDVALTEKILAPRPPTKFSSWLLTHSDAAAFSRVGLDLDTPDLTKICVFGALSPQGKSVVQGLLADTRKKYQIRCTTRRDLECDEVKEVISWDPSRISFVQADFDHVDSCKAAVAGMDGAFLVADLQETKVMETVNPEVEERRARNIIDACENSVKHLVFSTMETNDRVGTDLPHRELLELSPKARTAAYARSKKMSVTFVLMPCYSEAFFRMMDVRKDSEGHEKLVLKLPSSNGQKIMCMSVEELGTAVANIFDSYQCFAGHEIGLVTDFVTVSEVQEIFQDVFSEHTVEAETLDTKDWVEATDTYMKDLGQLFAGASDSKAIMGRHSMAKTLQLVPTARNLKRWVEQNRDNPAFREKLGLR